MEKNNFNTTNHPFSLHDECFGRRIVCNTCKYASHRGFYCNYYKQDRQNDERILKAIENNNCEHYEYLTMDNY